ncbi:MAG: Pr6Pr family membrane protein [Coriobacteriales bacterium]|jgi:hypothetical protein|nr:Pr6Pr family membrane protein [Coriobacteriales bacterium]
MRNTRVIALIYRSLAFIACLLGVLNVVGVFSGSVRFEALVYYTMETNIFATLMLGILAVRTALDIKANGVSGPASYFERLSLAAALAISVTLLVFWLILAPTAADPGFLLSYANLQIHLFAPLLMIVDYLLFAQPGKMKRHDPWLFALIPVYYFAQAMVLGFSGFVYGSPLGAGTRFPYFFLDFDLIGGWVFAYSFGILAFFLGLSYLLLWVDRKRARRAREHGAD